MANIDLSLTALLFIYIGVVTALALGTALATFALAKAIQYFTSWSLRGRDAILLLRVVRRLQRRGLIKGRYE